MRVSLFAGIDLFTTSPSTVRLTLLKDQEYTALSIQLLQVRAVRAVRAVPPARAVRSYCVAGAAGAGGAVGDAGHIPATVPDRNECFKVGSKASS